MQATTIKLENPLLKELMESKPRAQSLTMFVKNILAREIQNGKMARAAKKYNIFLKANAKENEWLMAWSEDGLELPPKKRGNKS